MGIVKHCTGDHEGALHLYERAKEIYEATGALQTPYGATLLYNMGVCKQDLGDSDGAMRLFKEGKRITEATGSQNAPLGAALRRMVGS
eukprot:5325855-Amphidinium_carterae.1